ncbi:hypothetical protein D3C86_812130 [compost metagenome]
MTAPEASISLRVMTSVATGVSARRRSVRVPVTTTSSSRGVAAAPWGAFARAGEAMRGRVAAARERRVREGAIIGVSV